MDIYEKRQAQKQINAEYRARARAMFPGVAIAETAHVVPMAGGGAFVEGTVWVPAPEVANDSNGA